MIGLALSMGASGALLPRQDQAAAAEVPAARFSLPTVPLALRIASMPGLGTTVAMATPQAAAYHTVAAGQTLWQIAQIHGVDVGEIEAANGVTQDTVLQVGQVLRVPVAATNRQPQAPLELALADEAPQLSQAQVLSASAEQDAQLKAQQDEALQTLNQKRDELSAVLSQVEAEAQFESEIAAQEGVPVIAKASPENALESSVGSSASSAETESVERLSKQPLSLDSSESVDVALEASPELSPVDPLTTATDETWQFESGLSLQPSAADQVETDESAAAASPNVTPQSLASSPAQSWETPAVEAPLVPTAEIAETVTALPAPIAVVPTAAQTYEIRSGDTVASIARDYGISASELADFNGITDPNFIVAGNVLAVPQQSLSPQTDNDALAAATPSVFQPEVEAADGVNPRLARLQATVIHRVDPADLLNKLRQQPTVAEIDDVAATAEASETPELAEAASDPYVANLLANVEVARQIQASQPEVPEVALGTVEASTRAVVPLNPEFSNRGSEPESPSLPNTLPQVEQAQLFAAAPLGSEVYAPLNPTPTGRVVSPAMPALPAADEFLPETPSHFNGYAWPTTGVLTSGYGWRWGRMHQGLDIAGPVGTPVMAAAPGVVERSGWNSGGYGNLVEIRHPDGSMTRYAHNSRLLVTPGQQVAQGQQIAEMGSTGYSTGPHLHFEIHLPGQGTVNPIAFLPSR
ncbi:peptidoglycan DD-metalloendopeptidase family protein [Almyronema epifaneia]|uniref:Peptidoglycan DD-metalloendopeptidase family protein n=1 Tax=Almyronema epifaneia S1 TaxID=2991925 RepID=A0ABW6IHZ2_9CYAN